MRFIADLHIHSHLSRATSKDLDLEHLHRVAQRKGITVVGTGDFTHPGWFAELREKLVPAEGGLFALREDLARAVNGEVPPACRAEVRFLLSVEVSSIYKKDGKVRKVHNLVYAPDFEVAAKISTRLASIGNIASDGRPILGLDSRDLLEIVLESSPDAYLVPAHIWTPWFSVLGAQSGFDAVTECFGDLAPHIFAAETGLSSDPAMNWRLSALDRYALVSNSDAHSPEKLGREASLFDCDLSYFALRDALRDERERFLGTIEFFPEEGKYHLDGHRKCGVVLEPRAAREAGGLCPACGKRLTAGVLGRVEELADRPEGARPEGAKPFRSLVPLTELLGELTDAGPTSSRVVRAYERLLERVGPELGVLSEVPIEDLERDGPPLFGEAIARMRAGRVQVRAGYDGEYGVVRVFDADERRRLLAQRSFAFALGGVGTKESLAESAPPERARPASTPPPDDGDRPERAAASPDLNPEQARVVDHAGGPILVLAGPGTGKTRTIAHRVARLVRHGGVSARAITAISFTRRAAGELRERLHALLGDAADSIQTLTFHALGLSLLRAFPERAGLPREFEVLDEAARLLVIEASRAPGAPSAAALGAAVSSAKAHLAGPDACEPEIAPSYAAYERALAARGAVDFDDLVVRAARLVEACGEARAWAQERCRFLFVDEYQDVNRAQEELVLLLAPAGPDTAICVVGDPDQAIYGFRGSDPSCMGRFAERYPGAAVVALRTNYRCPAAVVRAATRIVEQSPNRPRRPLEPLASSSPPIERYALATEADEAEFIARQVERALGGTSLLSTHAAREHGADDDPLAFHDIAVLFRLSAQGDAIGAALDRAGIPYQRAGHDPVTGRPAMTDLIARLRAEVGADQPRLPWEGEGRAAVADLVARLLPPGDVPREQRDAVDLLAALAVPFGKDARGFLEALPLVRETDVRLAPQKVALLTIHAAKGLEFPLVLLAGCEDNLLPLRLPGRPPADVEEERRLLYVAMTRAKRRLVLTAAKQRFFFGRASDNGPCPFLEGLSPALLAPTVIVARPKRSTRQLALF